MIVNGLEQYNEVLNRMDGEYHLYIPVYSDLYYHPTENSVLLVGIVFEDIIYVVSVAHEDATKFDISPTEFSILPDYSKAVLYAQGNTIPEIEKYYTNYVIDTHNRFGKMTNVNRVIPISLWASILERYATNLPIEQPSKYQSTLIKVLHEIEKSGLAVDEEILSQHFDDRTFRSFKGNLVYSQYNPFTSTGRPSNRFGNINFSALNKSDGSRDAFVSRYENGTLVQMDFEAYHLRLIADEFNIYLPVDESLHETFAKIYFNTENITDELYNESKKKTFEILYGITPNDYGIELFRSIRSFRGGFQNKNTVELPSGISVEVDDPSPSKLFNYYVQSLEVVRTLPKLEKVLSLLDGTNNHLTLYTYDSILLDMESLDEEILKNVRAILTENNKFPIRTYSGCSYNNLQSV